jgi:serine/threonine protein kinase
VVIERYSQSNQSWGIVQQDDEDSYNYKQLFRAAKAYRKLRLRVTQLEREPSPAEPSRTQTLPLPDPVQSDRSYLSDFEHAKINAEVFPGIVIERAFVSDSINGQRKVPKTKLWRVERVLGRGGSGEVRLEHNEEGSERRAVKRIWASGSTLKLAYERELKALMEFSKPKYKEAAVFVDFLGWFEDHESVYLAMEYLPLGDLEGNIHPRAGAISEPEIREITLQILEGLKIMHMEHFVHRDLKPKVMVYSFLFDLI